ncbi:MAG: hypothetical protein K8L97_33040 [Anaerolineae bacterium]|nr:hypothetical protein [Anaerolineae bacterium]
MNANPNGITLDQVYARRQATWLLEYKNQHQQVVLKVLHPNEIILYAWWDQDVSSRFVLELHLATDSRIIRFIPRQFDKKAVILDDVSFEYKYCKRAFLKKIEGNIFSRSRYAIHVDHSLSGRGMGDLDDKFYSEEEIEKIAQALTELINKAKDKIETTEHQTQLVDQIKSLFEVYQSGGLTEEQYKLAMDKLLKD